ncbi:unnamed protein product [Clonostachys rosea]|uniref:Probable dipeptidyl-aminopeptidase B n=1 Tax=Bionectria ochroleuca TaxID=29856 RepID=A0ABY6UR34_BIOOC|nr:unnamed protein product [Clonostachys rosea]
MRDLGWNEDGCEYRFIFHQRGFGCIGILAFACDSQVRLLLEEKSDTFLDYENFYDRVLKNNPRLLWASERDGYNHLYLIDLKQGLITTGNWNVKTVEHVDEEEGKLWVSAYGFWEIEGPYHLHLLSINFDGTNCRALTEGDGTHIWSWSPRSGEREFFVDSWSRVDQAPQTVIRSTASGEVQLIIDSTSTEDLKKQGWEPPERFAAPGRDGTTLIYGIITKPPNFEMNMKYPVLELIYSGPQGFFTPKSFGGYGTWARGGQVVVQMDGMGTNWRSKSFHDVCYKNLKDAGLPDRISWIKEAAKTRPWMDLTRIGAFGGSAGGDYALSALLHHGYFYKVAVSDSGSHDHRIGDLAWSEQWLGYPVDTSYEDNSNLTHVKKLRDDAKLMLVAGGMDNVVNPASTMRVVTALNRRRKDFEFFFIPEGGHNCGIGGSGYRRVRQFLQQSLGSGRDQKVIKEEVEPNC